MGGDLAEQHAHRPAIAGDVVDRQRQHVLVRAQPQQRTADRQPGRQVEPRRHQARDVAVQRRRVGSEVDLLEGECSRVDHLVRLAVMDLDAGAQDLVARHAGGDGGLAARTASSRPCSRSTLGMT